MNRLKEGFLHEVLNHIKSKEAKELIYKEVGYHLEQSKIEMVSKGLTEDEAEERAVKQMGSATELGQHLNKLHRPKMDWILLGLFIVTIVMSLLPIISVQDQSPANFLVKQALYIVIGTAVALVMMFVDYRKLENYCWIFLSVGLVILLALNLAPNAMVNGVKYIRLGDFTISGTTVLPFLMMFWSSYLSKDKPKLFVIIGVYLITLFMYCSLPSLTNVVIYSVLVLALFWGSALKRKIIYITIGSCAGLFAAFMTLFWFTSKSYQRSRIHAYLDYEQNATYNTQSLRELITSGGWFGNQTPKYLVNMTTDFAFSNITYYYGWILAGFIFVVLFLLLARMLVVSGQIKNLFGKQLVVGVSALFFIQFFYNIGMVLGFLPLISISLPFISYGMTPTVLNSLLIGIALSVYRRKNLVIEARG
jgi:cell division protein FtsW (lipid II flippase)